VTAIDVERKTREETDFVDETKEGDAQRKGLTEKARRKRRTSDISSELGKGLFLRELHLSDRLKSLEGKTGIYENDAEHSLRGGKGAHR